MPMVLLAVVVKVFRTGVIVERDALERPPTPKDPWTLPKSIFQPRMKEADSKGFFDTKRTQKAMLMNEWQRLRRKETVMAYLTREHGASPNLQPLEASLESVLDVLQVGFLVRRAFFR